MQRGFTKFYHHAKVGTTEPARCGKKPPKGRSWKQNPGGLTECCECRRIVNEVAEQERDSMSKMLDDARVLLNDAMFAGAMLNETLNPLLDWNPQDKAYRRRQWQVAENEIGKFLYATARARKGE